MPSYIRQYVYASPGLFCEQAERVGPATLEVIGRLFSIAEANGRVVEVEYDTASGILSQGKPTKRHSKRSPRTLETACKELIGLHPSIFTRISYSAVRDTVQRLIDEETRIRADEFIAEKLAVGNIMDILQGGKDGLYD
ncbi:MAG: hypothetical protein GX825_07705 [Syntrophomonadaceae bacterium]|nr:hypothetical protein [Syntrophomonadaceae bacterium]